MSKTNNFVSSCSQHNISHINPKIGPSYPFSNTSNAEPETYSKHSISTQLVL